MYSLLDNVYIYDVIHTYLHDVVSRYYVCGHVDNAEYDALHVSLRD